MAEGDSTSRRDEGDELLVERMRQSDREAAALFLLRRRDELEGWIGKHMRGVALASSDDVLSTLMRRFDRLVMSGRFRARDTSQTRSLLYLMARRAMVSIFRRHRSEQDLIAEVPVGSAAAQAYRSSEGDLERIRSVLADLDPDSYELLVRKLDGQDSTEIARTLGTTPEAVRQRWRALRTRLLDALRLSR